MVALSPSRLLSLAGPGLVLALLSGGCGGQPQAQPDAGFAPFALKLSESRTLPLTLEVEGHAVVELKGLLEGSSWKTASAESIVVKVVVDDGVLRHQVWVTGAEELSQGVHVGKLSAGPHEVTVTFDGLSRAAAATFQVNAARLYLPEDQTLARYAPIIFARDTSTTTDLPQIVYGGRGADGVLRYNLYYTNEDDGTGVDPPLLQARWGRLSDIEWLMETELDGASAVTTSRYQGPFHSTQTFSGKREGDQPLLKVGNAGTFEQEIGLPTKLKLSPAVYPWLPVNEPRERLMDLLPFLHRITDEESEREGKVDPGCTVATRLWPGRCQLLVDVEATSTVSLGNRRVWGLEMQTAAGVVRSELDHFTPALSANARQDRTGHLRLALPLAQGVEPLAVRLYAVDDGQGAFSVTVKNLRAYRLSANGAVTTVFTKPSSEATVSSTVLQGALWP